MSWCAMGIPLTANRNIAVMPVAVAAARSRLPTPTQKLVARRFCMPIKSAAVCGASRAHVGSLASPCQIGSKKGAQLPPFHTTLVAPNPEDAASTILELDERMARFCSKKRTTLGFGSPYAVRRVKWSALPWEIEANRPVCVYGRAFHQPIARDIASRTFGRRIRQCSLRTNTRR
jgi:hypothetical protein